MTDQEHFERHLATLILREMGLTHALERDADVDYKTAWVNQQWVTWKAALACRIVPQAVVVPPELFRQLKHYTLCHLLNFPSCGAPTEDEIDAAMKETK